MHRTVPRLLPFLAAALLAACAQPQQVSVVPGACVEAQAKFAVGYAHTDALAAEILRRSGARQARVVRPGDMVTMEHRPDRATIELGADNRVTRVRCG